MLKGCRGEPGEGRAEDPVKSCAMPASGDMRASRVSKGHRRRSCRDRRGWEHSSLAARETFQRTEPQKGSVLQGVQEEAAGQGNGHQLHVES